MAGVEGHVEASCGRKESVDARDNVLYHSAYRTTAVVGTPPGSQAREVRMYRPRHARSKHWRRRVFVAATLAGGTLLLAAPAFAGADKWTW